MPQTNKTTAPARTGTQSIPSAEDYCATLDRAAEQSRTLLTVKSPTVRIPPHIRTSMRSLETLNRWWATNRAILGVLEQGPPQPAKPTSKASKAAA